MLEQLASSPKKGDRIRAASSLPADSEAFTRLCEDSSSRVRSVALRRAARRYVEATLQYVWSRPGAMGRDVYPLFENPHLTEQDIIDTFEAVVSTGDMRLFGEAGLALMHNPSCTEDVFRMVCNERQFAPVATTVLTSTVTVENLPEQLLDNAAVSPHQQVREAVLNHRLADEDLRTFVAALS